MHFPYQDLDNWIVSDNERVSTILLVVNTSAYSYVSKHVLIYCIVSKLCQGRLARWKPNSSIALLCQYCSIMTGSLLRLRVMSSNVTRCVDCDIVKEWTEWQNLWAVSSAPCPWLCIRLLCLAVSVCAVMAGSGQVPVSAPLSPHTGLWPGELWPLSIEPTARARTRSLSDNNATSATLAIKMIHSIFHQQQCIISYQVWRVSVSIVFYVWWFLWSWSAECLCCEELFSRPGWGRAVTVRVRLGAEPGKLGPSVLGTRQPSRARAEHERDWRLGRAL